MLTSHLHLPWRSDLHRDLEEVGVDVLEPLGRGIEPEVKTRATQNVPLSLSPPGLAVLPHLPRSFASHLFPAISIFLRKAPKSAVMGASIFFSSFFSPSSSDALSSCHHQENIHHRMA